MKLDTKKTLIEKSMSYYKNSSDKSYDELYRHIEELESYLRMCEICGKQSELGISFEENDRGANIHICSDCVQKAAFMIETAKQSKQP